MSLAFSFAYEPLTVSEEIEHLFVTQNLNWSLGFGSNWDCMQVTQEDLRAVGVSDTFIVKVVWGYWSKPFLPEEVLQWAKRWLELWPQPTGNERIEDIKSEWMDYEDEVIKALQSLAQLAIEAQANHRKLILMIT